MTSPRILVVTDSIDFVSVDYLARQIHAEAVAQGRDCEIVKPGKPTLEAMAGCRVINLKEGDAYSYAKQFRWVHPTAFLTVLAGNWQEHNIVGRLSLLGTHLKPKFAGVPVSLVAHSAYTMREVQETIRSTFAASMGRQCLGQLHMVPCGIEDGFAPGTNDPDFLVVPFTHPSGHKQPDIHYWASRAYSVLATQKGFTPEHHYWGHPSDKFAPLSPEAAALYTVQDQPAYRAEFRKNIAGAGMFLCTSSWESFGLYYLELLVSGAVGVFLDAPWIRDLLPTYRFIGQKDELVGMMLHIRENFAEVRDYVLTEVLPEILSKYTIAKFSQGLFALLESMETPT